MVVVTDIVTLTVVGMVPAPVTVEVLVQADLDYLIFASNMFQQLALQLCCLDLVWVRVLCKR